MILRSTVAAIIVKKTIFNVYAPTKLGFSVLQKLTLVSWWEFSTAYLDTLFNKFCWVKMNCQVLVNDEKALGNDVYIVKIFFASTITLSVKVAKLCPTLCNPMDYTVHGILQARVLEWVAFPFSGGSSQPRDWTQVSCIASRFFTSWANGSWRLLNSFAMPTSLTKKNVSSLHSQGTALILWFSAFIVHVGGFYKEEFYGFQP